MINDDDSVAEEGEDLNSTEDDGKEAMVLKGRKRNRRQIMTLKIVTLQRHVNVIIVNDLKIFRWP